MFKRRRPGAMLTAVGIVPECQRLKNGSRYRATVSIRVATPMATVGIPSSVGSITTTWPSNLVRDGNWQRRAMPTVIPSAPSSSFFPPTQASSLFVSRQSYADGYTVGKASILGFSRFNWVWLHIFLGFGFLLLGFFFIPCVYLVMFAWYFMCCFLCWFTLSTGGNLEIWLS
jgi:hypothetical protein